MDTSQLTPLQQTIYQRASDKGIDPSLALGVAETESGFNPKAVNPTSGATGTMQVMPATYQQLVHQGRVDPKSPTANIDAGLEVLKDALANSGGDKAKALAQYGGFVTKDPSGYISKVFTNANKYGGNYTVPDNTMVQVPPQVIQAANTDATRANDAYSSLESEKQGMTGATNDLINALTGKAQADATVNQEKNRSINETVGMTQRAATALGTNMQGTTQNIVEALGPKLAIARQNLNDALTARNQGDAKTITTDPLGWLINSVWGHDHNQQLVQNYAQTNDALANEIRSANELTQSQNVTNAAVTAGISATRDKAESQSILQGAQVASAEANIKAATGRSNIDQNELSALHEHLQAETLPTQLQIQAQNASYFGAMRQAIMQNKQLQTQDIAAMNKQLLGVGTAINIPGLNIEMYKRASPVTKSLIDSYMMNHQYGGTVGDAVINSKMIDGKGFTPGWNTLRSQLQTDYATTAAQVGQTATDRKQIPALVNNKLQEKYAGQYAYPENGNTVYRINPHAMLNEQGIDWNSAVGKVIAPLLQSTQGQQLDSDSILSGVQGGVKAGLYTNQQAGQFLSQMYSKAIQANNSSYMYKRFALPEMQKYNVAGTLGYNTFGNKKSEDVDMTNAASVSNFLLKKAITQASRDAAATNPIGEFQQ